MSMQTANQNKDLIQILLSDNLFFQQKIKDQELLIIELETSIAELKKQNLKINIENGKLIMQKNTVSKELKEKETLLDQMIKDKEQEFSDLNQKIILHEETISHLSQTNVELTTRNKMLSDTCKILLRQNSDYNENKKLLLSQIEQLSIQNKELIDKSSLLSSQNSSIHIEYMALNEHIKQLTDKLKITEERERNFTFSSVVSINNLIIQNQQLKQQNAELLALQDV